MGKHNINGGLMKKKDDLTIQFEALGIPIIDEESPEDIVKGIEQIMNGWDVVGRQRAEVELKRSKVIIAKLVRDWVNPYAREGRKVPVVLFSTHPEWKAGTRFDNGLMECTFIERLHDTLFGYFVIVFDDQNRIRTYNREKYRWE